MHLHIDIDFNQVTADPQLLAIFGVDVHSTHLPMEPGQGKPWLNRANLSRDLGWQKKKTSENHGCLWIMTL